MPVPSHKPSQGCSKDDVSESSGVQMAISHGMKEQQIDGECLVVGLLGGSRIVMLDWVHLSGEGGI